MENIILSTDEDITEFTDDEQVKVQMVNLELKQKCWLDGEKRDFMIFNWKQCYQKVEYKTGGKKKFRINLSYLNAIPESRVQYAYNWFIFSLLMFVMAVLSLYSLARGHQVDQLITASVAASTVLLSIGALVIGYIKSTCRITFYSHYGRAPILELIKSSPNSKDYVTFVEVLQRKINTFNQPVDGDLRAYLHKELDELRRLKNESVLSSAEFNSAMQRIIKNGAYKV